MTTDMKEKVEKLIAEFMNYDLNPLNNYIEDISTKSSDKRIYPPYIPLIGKDYEKFKILVYATAQNFYHLEDSNPDCLEKKYSEIDDRTLVKRLYFNTAFTKEYPDAKDFGFADIKISPYESGVLPAVAGIFIYAIFGEKLTELNNVHDYIAISNYYKFSLNKKGKKKDINPNNLKNGDEYYKLNDELALKEIEVLQPSHIITFRGRHNSFLKKNGFIPHEINDPSWILKGGSGCLSQNGSWSRDNRDKKSVDLIGTYKENFKWRYAKKVNAISVYLMKYYSDWIEKKSLRNEPT